MLLMRAKLTVSSVTQHETYTGNTPQETVRFRAVAAKAYPADGSDEDNTYAKFSPSADMTIVIANPALVGKLKPNMSFYVDFTSAE